MSPSAADVPGHQEIAPSATAPGSGTEDGPAYPAPSRFRGRLIAVEGIDGSGKSTQVHLLARWVEALGYAVHVTAWNSSPLIRPAMRRAKRDRRLTPVTFSLMHAADLADRIEREVLPRLRAGHVILADRWVCTALARDVARGIDEAWVRRLYAFAPRPRLSIYFRVPVEVAIRRLIVSRAVVKYYEAGLDLGLDPDPVISFGHFQQRVLDRYEALVQSERLTVVDACEPVARQQEIVRRAVRRVLRGVRRAAVGPAPAAAEGPGAR